MNVSLTGVDGSGIREIQRKQLEFELADIDVGSLRIAILITRRARKSDYLKFDMLPNDIKKTIGDRIGNGYISLMYVDEVKGIEFDRVYVIPNKMSNNEKYIAYTRALSELVIVVGEEITD